MKYKTVDGEKREVTEDYVGGYDCEFPTGKVDRCGADCVMAFEELHEIGQKWVRCACGYHKKSLGEIKDNILKEPTNDPD